MNFNYPYLVRQQRSAANAAAPDEDVVIYVASPLLPGLVFRVSRAARVCRGKRDNQVVVASTEAERRARQDAWRRLGGCLQQLLREEPVEWHFEVVEEPSEVYR